MRGLYIGYTYTMEKTKENNKEEFVITKRIAKHGSQAIVVIPRILEGKLRPGTIAKMTIEILDGGEND